MFGSDPKVVFGSDPGTTKNGMFSDEAEEEEEEEKKQTNNRTTASSSNVFRIPGQTKGIPQQKNSASHS